MKAQKIRICSKCFVAMPKEKIKCPACGHSKYSLDAFEALDRLMHYVLEDEIHYVSKANSIAFVKKTFHLSERDMAQQIAMSKSELHRMLKISRLPKEIKEKAVFNKIEKWALIRLSEASGVAYNEIYHGIMTGQITRHSQVKLGLKRLKKILN